MVTRYGVASFLAWITGGFFIIVCMVYCGYRAPMHAPSIARCHIDQHISFSDSVVILQRLLQQSCVARRVTLQRQEDGIRVRVL